MSNLIVITPEMYKVAEFPVDVKFRKPGNVVEYVRVEFEIFRDGEYYKAVPLQDSQTKILTTLPCELLFEVKEGKIYNHTEGKEEVVEDVVCKLAELNLVEPLKKVPENE